MLEIKKIMQVVKTRQEKENKSYINIGYQIKQEDSKLNTNTITKHKKYNINNSNSYNSNNINTNNININRIE